MIRQGSPPQVRGKHRADTKKFYERRITPAGAGKTVDIPSLASGVSDHPRRCGENRNARKFAFTSYGSPPQVRGKLAQ